MNAWPKYSGWSDPQRLETWGGALADQLRDVNVDRVLIGEDAEDVQLAHVVARELGSQIVRVLVVDGIFAVEGDLGPGHRVAMVTDAIRRAEPVLAIELFVRGLGAELVAVATLARSPQLAALDPTVPTVIGLMSGEDWLQE